MGKNPVYIVYYREIPEEINDFIQKNDNFSYIKDGIHKLDKHQSLPRLTVYFEGDRVANKEKIQNLWWIMTKIKISGGIVDCYMVEGNA